MQHRGPYTQHNGPFYTRPAEDGVAQGFIAEARHCNSLGIVHGGLLATFLDGMLGHAVAGAVGGPAVTVHLSLDFLAMARSGDWVEGEARVIRRAGDIAFAEARAFAIRRDVARATAVFKVLRARSG
jgi:acyl-coenzyme A thioesterase PaaI-like protein